VKHLLLILSFLLLSSPVIGEETGVLFLREVNDNWGWFEDGNKDKDAKYIGEFKDGLLNGQGISTLFDGRKYVGEFKDGKRWNGTMYDKEGNIIGKWWNGVKQ